MESLRKRHLAAACTLMASCASGGAPMPIVTTVQAWPSGVSLMFNELGGHTSLVVEVHDHGGSNEKLLWRVPNVQALPGYQRLVVCVEDVRAKAPSDLRNAVLRCVETSGMPSPEVIPEPDATQYRAAITVGVLGARRRLRPPPSAINSVAADVAECMRAAQQGDAGIQLLVGRFDACLRKRSYVVDDPPRAPQGK